MIFNIDFSMIDRMEMRNLNITPDEIVNILNNRSSYFEANEDFIYVLGFSTRRKFIQMAYRVSKNVNFEIEVLQVDLPYEKDIKQNWCGFS
ncbi:MAG TPA: hypothetical protein VIN08_03140 [Ohtaekwangia sp.]|uniref:hypothetical protein n=1 Tax=Ohtaekwangia sp. TaxID=2066019 RepID=UPI002F92A61E